MVIICYALSLYAVAVLGRVILGYLRVPSDHVVGVIYNFLGRITNPVLRLISSVVPEIPVGSVRLDLSPMILLFIVLILQSIIC